MADVIVVSAAYTAARMRVAVIGAGGTGGLYGALLARAGHDVRFLARGAHFEAIRANGLAIRSAQLGTFTVPARVVDQPGQLGAADVVLLAVKTPDLVAASQAATRALGPETPVLTLQNGVEAPDRVAAVVGLERVLVGTTGLETTILEPGVIGHLSTSHFLRVAELDGPPTPRVETLVQLLVDAGINASSAPSGRLALWEKARFLIPLAGVTAVCRTTIGPIVELPETRALAAELCAEVAAVASACGYPVEPSDFSALADTQPTMKASMARDFERGKPTELDELVGAIVRLGAERGVDVPAHRHVYAILKLREQQSAASR